MSKEIGFKKVQRDLNLAKKILKPKLNDIDYRAWQII